MKKKYAESLYRTPSKEDPHAINLKYVHMFINQKMENIHIYILQLDLLEASDNDDIY